MFFYQVVSNGLIIGSGSRASGHSSRGLAFIRVLGPFVARQWRQGDIQVAVAQHLGWRISLAISGGAFDEFVDDFKADLLVRLLPPSEAQLHPNLHFIAKELDGVAELHLQIVRINGRRDLELFHFGGRLAGVGIFVSLGFLVEKFAIVGNSADGRGGGGRNLDQIHAFGLGQTQSFIEGHNPQLLLLITNNPNLAGANLAVAPMQGLAGLIGARKRATQ